MSPPRRPSGGGGYIAPTSTLDAGKLRGMVTELDGATLGLSLLDRDAAEHRIAELEEELSATTSKLERASFEHEIAHLQEHVLGSMTDAVRNYLAAFNHAPSRRASVDALIRIFERRGSHKNLARLHQTLARVAEDPHERAHALTDLAVFEEDHGGSPEASLARVLEAREASPDDPTIALHLEQVAAHANDPGARREAIATRAAHCADPELRALLRGEVARDLEAEGRVEEALEILRKSASNDGLRFRTLRHIEAIARRFGRADVLVEALEGQADLAAAASQGRSDTGETGAFGPRRFGNARQAAAAAASAWLEAAQLRASALDDTEGARVALDQALLVRPDDLSLRWERHALCLRTGDLSRAAQDARHILAKEPDPTTALAFQLMLLGEARTNGRSEAAEAAMEAATALAPDSPVLRALLTPTAMSGEGPGERVTRELREAPGGGPRRALHLWRAAAICDVELDDPRRALELLEEASGHAEGLALRNLLRERRNVAGRLGDRAPPPNRHRGPPRRRRPLVRRAQPVAARPLHRPDPGRPRGPSAEPPRRPRRRRGPCMGRRRGAPAGRGQSRLRAPRPGPRRARRRHRRPRPGHRPSLRGSPRPPTRRRPGRGRPLPAVGPRIHPSPPLCIGSPRGALAPRGSLRGGGRAAP